MTTLLPGGRIEFRFFRPAVSSVAIAGSFNAWATDQTLMTHQGDGWWHAELCLPEGEYQFRYYADGTWYTDHAACGIERSRSAWNSVLVVPAARKRVAA